MRLLLDTSAYSAFMRGHPEVKLALQRADSIFLNPVVLGELHSGFLCGTRLRRNQEELGRLLASPRVGILEITKETAIRYAFILTTLRRAGTPVPTNDLWIAATAMEHGLSVLTLAAHYLRIPQVMVVPLEPSEG